MYFITKERGFLMKKSWILLILLFFVIVGFFVTKEGWLTSPIYSIKALIFRDRINQMFRENQVLINRFIAIFENGDDEKLRSDEYEPTLLDRNFWMENYESFVFDEKSESNNEMLKNKVMNQLLPIRSDYKKLADKYRDILDQRALPGNGVNENMVGYTVKNLWFQAIGWVGENFIYDVGDYRRTRIAIAMHMIVKMFKS